MLAFYYTPLEHMSEYSETRLRSYMIFLRLEPAKSLDIKNMKTLETFADYLNIDG